MSVLVSVIRLTQLLRRTVGALPWHRRIIIVYWFYISDKIAYIRGLFLTSWRLITCMTLEPLASLLEVYFDMLLLQ